MTELVSALQAEVATAGYVLVTWLPANWRVLVESWEVEKVFAVEGAEYYFDPTTAAALAALFHAQCSANQEYAAARRQELFAWATQVRWSWPRV